MNVLIAGTGSVCMAYQREDGKRFTRVAKCGGAGFLLGDEGSGFYIGKSLISTMLIYFDSRNISGMSHTRNLL